jgi:hypothetical protein
VNESEPAPDDARIAKKPAHVFRARVGSYVEVLGSAIEQQIAHTAAHEVGLKTVPRQTANDLLRIGVDARLIEASIDPRWFRTPANDLVLIRYEERWGAKIQRRLGGG